MTQKEREEILSGFVAAITRRIRFPGRERILRLFFHPERYRREGAPPRILDSYDGNLSIVCDPGSYLEWCVFFKGYFNPDLSFSIKRLIHPGDLAIDVGANAGAYSLLMAKRVGARGRVIAYEPNPEMQPRLIENIGRNDFGRRIDVEKTALADRAGRAVLHIPLQDNTNRCIASLRPDRRLLIEGIQVEITTLDDEMHRKSLDGLDFLKIDTEGWDPRVILGGSTAIREFRPIILFEVNYTAAGHPPDLLGESMEFLGGLGYKPFSIEFYGKIHEFPWPATLSEGSFVCLNPAYRLRG
jgi:FkbM family methyltransferase